MVQYENFINMKFDFVKVAVPRIYFICNNTIPPDYVYASL